jgi:hypothetical protein
MYSIESLNTGALPITEVGQTFLSVYERENANPVSEPMSEPNSE